MLIVVDNKIPFIKGVLEKYAEINYLPAEKIINSNIKNADAIIIRSVTKCNEELLNNTRVKFVVTATIGFDHIDIDYCVENSIVWKNVPGCNSTAVQQYTINSILYIAKHYHLDLNKITLGVVGVGNIGLKVVKAARELGINVLMNDPPRERNENDNSFVSLEYIKKHSNIITLHVPLTSKGIDKTFHLVDSDFLKGVQKKPFIINTSRGEVADNNALLEAIEQSKIQKSVIDVWENEPFINELLAQNVLIATPHIAGYSVEGKAKASLFSVLEIAKFFHFNIKKADIEKLIMPQKKNLLINCKDEDEFIILKTLLENTYSLKNDHELLLYNLHNFEKLRSEYNYRHDYIGYQVTLKNCSFQLKEKLKNIGFDII